jgi:hypothetical protein
MNRMVDALVESETSEAAPPVSSFPVIQDGYPGTPTGNAFETDTPTTFNYVDAMPSVDTALATNYPTIRSSKTPTSAQLPPGMPYSPRPNLPSIFNTAFAPQPGEAAASPQSRPGTARQSSPPGFGSHQLQTENLNFPSIQGPMSSYTAFQQSLNTHKQALQSSPYDSPSSWESPTQPSQPYAGMPMNGQHHLHRLSHLQQFPQMRASFDNRQLNNNFSSSPFSYMGGSMDNSSPRSINANLGAIGQTPPSGQGG